MPPRRGNYPVLPPAQMKVADSFHSEFHFLLITLDWTELGIPVAAEIQGCILPKMGSPSDANHPQYFPSLTGEEAQPNGAGLGNFPCFSGPGLS